MKNIIKTLSFNNLFAIFLAMGFFKETVGCAALSAFNQSVVNMKTVLNSPLLQKELSPYHRVIDLREWKQEEDHIFFIVKTEVITDLDANGLPVIKNYVADVSVKPNHMPGRPILEVMSIHQTNDE